MTIDHQQHEGSRPERALGIRDVLVVCDATNEASARTIVRNGGVQPESFTEKDGKVIKRFWIRQ